MKKFFLLLALVASFGLMVETRKHHLTIRNDARKFFLITDFGFFTGGFLAVNVSGFHIIESGQVGNKSEASPVLDVPSDLILGFSIDKTTNGMNRRTNAQLCFDILLVS